MYCIMVTCAFCSDFSVECALNVGPETAISSSYQGFREGTKLPLLSQASGRLIMPSNAIAQKVQIIFQFLASWKFCSKYWITHEVLAEQ